MDVDAFIAMNRGINEGGDLPDDFLRAMYASVAGTEIELAVETDVVTFFNPVKDGWLLKRSKGARVKKWNRRWFLLNDNCLYYFTNPEQEINEASPRGIFPLDGTVVEKVGTDSLRLRR